MNDMRCVVTLTKTYINEKTVQFRRTRKYWGCNHYNVIANGAYITEVTPSTIKRFALALLLLIDEDKTHQKQDAVESAARLNRADTDRQNNGQPLV
jgi:hypothetical protein